MTAPGYDRNMTPASGRTARRVDVQTERPPRIPLFLMPPTVVGVILPSWCTATATATAPRRRAFDTAQPPRHRHRSSSAHPLVPEPVGFVHRYTAAGATVGDSAGVWKSDMVYKIQTPSTDQLVRSERDVGDTTP